MPLRGTLRGPAAVLGAYNPYNGVIPSLGGNGASPRAKKLRMEIPHDSY